MSTALSAPQQQSTVPPLEDPGPDWKRQLAERLDAYRSKHPGAISQVSSTSNAAVDSRASRIARSVASRYAAAPTYSELLLAASQAEQAAAEAQAALAEHVAHDARAAQEKLAREATATQQREVESSLHESFQNSEIASSEKDAAHYGSATHTQPATPVMPQFAERSREMHIHQTAPEPEPTLEDLWASALVEPRSLLPSKLIEFPRELVSSKRARPRLPENPDRETSQAAQQLESAQLRIFEVQPELETGDTVGLNVYTGPPVSALETEIDSSAGEAAISSASNGAMPNLSQSHGEPVIPSSTAMTPDPATAIGLGTRTSRPSVSIPMRSDVVAGRASHMPAARAFKSLEWAAISLDKEPATRTRRLESSVAECVPFLVEPASIDRRLMAFAVDFAAVTAGFLGFLVVFVASTPHLPTGLTAIVLAGAVYTSLWVLYQMLFFSLSGATAGMLYARIALCTFDDQNPSRRVLRRRLGAWWLSCLPLGIGFLWCFVDEDNLSWHDRMTGMYQRSY